MKLKVITNKEEQTKDKVLTFGKRPEQQKQADLMEDQKLKCLKIGIVL